MPSIVEKQLESRRSEPLEHQIDRSDHSRHSNLSQKIAARSAAIFFSDLRASSDQIDRWDARERWAIVVSSCFSTIEDINVGFALSEAKTTPFDPPGGPPGDGGFSIF